jgi:hypothetical protein
VGEEASALLEKFREEVWMLLGERMNGGFVVLRAGGDELVRR